MKKPYFCLLKKNILTNTLIIMKFENTKINNMRTNKT